MCIHIYILYTVYVCVCYTIYMYISCVHLGVRRSFIFSTRRLTPHVTLCPAGAAGSNRPLILLPSPSGPKRLQSQREAPQSRRSSLGKGVMISLTLCSRWCFKYSHTFVIVSPQVQECHGRQCDWVTMMDHRSRMVHASDNSGQFPLASGKQLARMKFDCNPTMPYMECLGISPRIS